MFWQRKFTTAATAADDRRLSGRQNGPSEEKSKSKPKIKRTERLFGLLLLVVVKLGIVNIPHRRIFKLAAIADRICSPSLRH